MGHTISHAFNKIFRKGPFKFIVVGLDYAGKTSLFYNLTLKETNKIPNLVCYGYEIHEYWDFVFTVWDLGGGLKLKPLWHELEKNSEGVIFVIDSIDRGMIEKATEELHKFSAEIAEFDLPMLIFVNKQDCEGAMSLEEITKALHLECLKQKHWEIRACSAVTKEGVLEGIQWLQNVVSHQRE